MKIICPKCELKGQVDAVPTGTKTRVACVRCATMFDAVLVNGEIQALLPQAGHAVAGVESPWGGVHAAGDVAAVEAEFAPVPETPQEMALDDSLAIEESHFTADDVSTPTQDLMLGERVEATQTAPQENTDELASQSIETQVQEAADTGEDSPAVAHSPEFNGAKQVSRPPSDGYGMGVRLMRVSPVWLLLAGLGFISFIVLCNWLIKPTETTGDAARLIATANNHATNQSANSVTTPASTAQSPVNNRASQPLNQTGVAFIPAEAKETKPPAAAPSVEPIEAKPVVEEKPAIPASTPNRAGESKDGKVTIQIGSYNAAAEAATRVADLKSAGFEARSVEVVIPKRGTWYRVQSGRFVSRDEAERYGKQLRDRGIVSSFITTDVKE
jgi:cell division septation protein DedD